MADRKAGRHTGFGAATPATGLRSQIVLALTVNATIVLAACSIAAFLAKRPTWLTVQRYVVGSVLAALAVKIATDRARPAVA